MSGSQRKSKIERRPSVKLTGDLAALLIQKAVDEDRPAAWVVTRLLNKGLAAEMDVRAETVKVDERG